MEEETEDKQSDIETVYQQAAQFIQLTDELRDAPESIKVKYGQLESLRDQLSNMVEELTRQTSSAES